MVAPVEDLIQSKGLEYRYSGRDVLIRCLNPEHEDRNPSLRVDKLTGLAHCFSCGFKANIFQYFGVVGGETAGLGSKLKEKIAKVISESIGLEMPKGLEPYTREFKGVSGATMRRFEAFTHKDYEERVMIPIRDTTGKIVCFQGRHVIATGTPKYKFYPGGVEVPLFPARVPLIHNTVILVEGMYDALNLIDKGLENIMATMGTQGLGGIKGLNKDKVLHLKLMGAHKILFIFDGDQPGQKAVEILKPQLEKAGFVVDNIELNEGDDPGDMPLDDVQRIKSLL